MGVLGTGGHIFLEDAPVAQMHSVLRAAELAGAARTAARITFSVTPTLQTQGLITAPSSFSARAEDTRFKECCAADFGSGSFDRGCLRVGKL